VKNIVKEPGCVIVARRGADHSPGGVLGIVGIQSCEHSLCEGSFRRRKNFAGLLVRRLVNSAGLQIGCDRLFYGDFAAGLHSCGFLGVAFWHSWGGREFSTCLFHFGTLRLAIRGHDYLHAATPSSSTIFLAAIICTLVQLLMGALSEKDFRNSMHKSKPPQFPRHKFTDNNIHINMKQLSRLNNEQKSLDQNTLLLNYTQVYEG
jgi:hypothetical protein